MSVERVALGEIATIVAGQSPAGSTYNEGGFGMPFFQGKADFGDSHPIARKWCTEPRKIAEAGDILISVRAPVGPTNVAGERCCIGRGLAAIRPDESVATRDFVLWAIKQRAPLLVAKAQGSTFPAIGQKDLKNLLVPFRPLHEQRRIVAILNRAAKIERLRAQAAERLREFVPALFERMFGDPVQNPKGWVVAKLGEVGTLDRGRSRHRPRNAPELYGGPYPFVQTGDVAGSGGIIRQASQCYSDLGLRQSKMWPAGTLCITIAANIGETGVLAFDACFPDSVVGFVPKQDLATVEYVQGALDSMQARLEEGAPMAAQRNINLRILRALPLAIPPVELQRRFGRVVWQARGVAETVGAGTASASKVTQALMRRLLGEPA